MRDLLTDYAAKAYRETKSLSGVERAFRSLKIMDLHVRPIHHRQPDRVRAHIFLCMLAYYVEWHMRKNLAPLLFDDEDKAAAQKLRASVVAPAQRSTAAQAKALSKRTHQTSSPFAAPVTTRLLSGENAAALPVSPAKFTNCLPVTASQTRAVLSALVVTMRCPSGEGTAL